MNGMSCASFLNVLARTRLLAHRRQWRQAVSASVSVERSIALSVWWLPNFVSIGVSALFAAVVYQRLMHCNAS
jgi:hypothetical protein